MTVLRYDAQPVQIVHPGSNSDMQTVSTDYNSSVAGSYSTLEAIDSHHAVLVGAAAMGPPPSSGSQSVYLDDGYDSQDGDGVYHDGGAHSATNADEREVSTFSDTAVERSHIVMPQPLLKPKTIHTDSNASSCTHYNLQDHESDTQANDYIRERHEGVVDLSDKIVVCFTSFNGKIGCSYYDPMHMKLFLIEDQVDSSKFDLAMNIIDQADPYLTLVSNRADEGLVDAIKKKLSQCSGNYTPTVEIRANREFQSSQGRAYLLDLPVTTGEEESLCDAPDSRRRSETEIEAVKAGQEGFRRAQEFMRLRRKRVAPRQGHLRRFVNSLRLGGSVTLDSEKSLETVACLFSYLNRKRNVGELAGEGRTVDVAAIELISLNKVMLVNTDTLCSLQIFESEDHANIHASLKREGLSLFNMLNTTKTGLGKALLKRWLLQPSTEAEVLNDRLNAVECFSRPANIHISQNIQKILTVKNLPRLLQALIAGHDPVQQWSALEQFLSACISVSDLIGNLLGGKDIAILQKLCDSFEVGLFSDLNELINSKIDWIESKDHHRVCIQEGIDQRLDDNRRTYHGLPSMLSKIAQHISKGIHPDFCQSLNVIYFPQLGYLCAIPLPEEFPNPIMDRATTAGWQFQFSTEISVYYKNQEMRDLDTHIGDLHGFIVDREVEILQEMLKQHGHVSYGRAPARLLAEGLVPAVNWTRPIITESNVIRITKGRHPLVEQCVDDLYYRSRSNEAHLVGGRGISKARLQEIQNKPDAKTFRTAARVAERLEAVNSAMANGISREEAESMADEMMSKKSRVVNLKKEDGTLKTVEVDSDGEQDDSGIGEESLLSPDDSILILTGANASGKSVFLKSVAIIVYMAHIGSFVPAEEAIIGLTDKIVTRVTTRESVSRGTSAFMIDLQQISLMYIDKPLARPPPHNPLMRTDRLRNCTERSLLIIDEFGKGTNSVDGAALFVGLVKHLVSKGPHLPKTILATHFHEVFFDDFLKAGLPVGLAHMELIIDREIPHKSDPKTEGKVVGLTPLFKLAPGLCLKSYAFHCAESFGIPQKIVERALEVSTAISSYNVHEIMDPQMTADDEKELLEAEQIVRRLLQMDWDAHEDANQVSCMKKLAHVLGRQYIEETDEVLPMRRDRASRGM